MQKSGPRQTHGSHDMVDRAIFRFHSPSVERLSRRRHTVSIFILCAKAKFFDCMGNCIQFCAQIFFVPIVAILPRRSHIKQGSKNCLCKKERDAHKLNKTSRASGLAMHYCTASNFCMLAHALLRALKLLTLQNSFPFATFRRSTQCTHTHFSI